MAPQPHPSSLSLVFVCGTTIRSGWSRTAIYCYCSGVLTSSLGVLLLADAVVAFVSAITLDQFSSTRSDTASIHP